MAVSNRPASAPLAANATSGGQTAGMVLPGGGPLISASDCPPDVRDAYHTLAANVEFSLLGTRSAMLMGASIELGQDSAGEVMINLAMVLAESGDDVLLVDCNMHQPTLHQIMGVPNDNGLAQLLSGQWSDNDQIARQTMAPNLRIITSGSANPAPLRSSATTEILDVLGRLRAAADRVLLVGPPILAFIETLHMCSAVDGLLAIVPEGAAQRQALRRTRTLLARVNAPLIGAVVLGDAR